MTVATRTRRVLVIAYYFPPLGLSGVQRTLKFAKYLPEFGWHPTVLTVEDRGYFARDESLLREIEGRPVEVVRTKSLDPLSLFRKRPVVPVPNQRMHRGAVALGHFLFIPDTKIGWKRHALRAARKLQREAPFDMIYATAPPYTDFLIARDLKKEFGVPVVLDYRDPWLENPLHLYPTPLHRFMHHHLELSVIRHADHIITINRRLKELTIRSSRSLTYHDISIVPQGFDPADFAELAPPLPRSKLRITHAGTFYLDRTPKHLLQALRIFLAEHPSARGDIELAVAGNLPEDHRAWIAEYGLDDVVSLRGYLPHAECIALMRDSDALWLMIPDGQEATSTGKLYEYLGARRTILATVPDCAARQTLEKSGAAIIAPPSDIPAIVRAIEQLHAWWKKRALPVPSEQFVTQFDRRILTGQLSRIFEGILHRDEHEFQVGEVSE